MQMPGPPPDLESGVYQSPGGSPLSVTNKTCSAPRTSVRMPSSSSQPLGASDSQVS